MNKLRRKSINELVKLVKSLPDEMGDFISTLESIKDEIEEIKSEEEDSLDNLPEGIQDSDRGYAMQEAIDRLDEALSCIDGIIGDLQNVPDALADELIELLEEAAA